jgi:hypothetical protein
VCCEGVQQCLQWQLCCFWSKVPCWKRKCEMMHCHDTTATSFVAKVLGKVFSHFHTVVVERYSGMQNWLFSLLGWILCEQFPWIQWERWACSWLCSSPVSPFRSRWVWTFLVQLILPSPNACLIIARVSITPVFRFAQNLMLFFWQIHGETASDQIHFCK